MKNHWKWKAEANGASTKGVTCVQQAKGPIILFVEHIGELPVVISCYH